MFDAPDLVIPAGWLVVAVRQPAAHVRAHPQHGAPPRVRASVGDEGGVQREASRRPCRFSGEVVGGEMCSLAKQQSLSGFENRDTGDGTSFGASENLLGHAQALKTQIP